jgi:hypothetical protein
MRAEGRLLPVEAIRNERMPVPASRLLVTNPGSLVVDHLGSTQGAGTAASVNVMRIPYFGRRMTIGRASIV